MANITLKRDAPFRGGFEGLLFFRLRWLRQSSVTGAPLSFTLGILGFMACCVMGFRHGKLADEQRKL
jgi:hypothetical protein